MSGTPVLLLMVGLGGLVGTWARFRLGGAVYERVGPDFPWGTLTVNVLGSFVLGLLLPLFDARAPLTPLRALIMVGCIGAFTTFSSFAYEAAMLISSGERRRAGIYAAASLGLGLVSLLSGLMLSRAVF